MRQILELVLIGVVLIGAFELPITKFFTVMVATIALYFYTMYNSFNDGYAQAIDDRVY